MSSLEMAIHRGDHAMARTLLQLGADCNEPNEMIGILGHAVQRDDEERVKLLLESGADANGAPGANMSPLLLAVVSKNLEMVRLLLRRGADPKTGGLVLRAMSRNHPEIHAAIQQHQGSDPFDSPF